MKAFKTRKPLRLLPDEAVRIAAEQAPAQPPARLGGADRPTTLNLRLRTSTVADLARKARAEGTTQKLLLCRAMAAAGIAVAAEDLEDRTPRRRSV